MLDRDEEESHCTLYYSSDPNVPFGGVATSSFLSTEEEWHYFSGGLAVGMVFGILVGAGIVIYLSKKRV